MYSQLILAVGVILAFNGSTFAANLTAAESTPGDRSLPINQVYPADAFYHNGKGGRVLRS